MTEPIALPTPGEVRAVWTLDGPGASREARLSPVVGAALPPEPYGYDDYAPRFFSRFEGADERAIAETIEASFEALVMLPPDTPKLAAEEEDPAVVTVQLGTPLPVGACTFVWVARRAVHAPGQWVEERYWVRVDEEGAPADGQDPFGALAPWSRATWRRES